MSRKPRVKLKNKEPKVEVLEFSANSSVAKTTPITVKGAKEEKIVVPRVWYTPTAHSKIMHTVAVCTKEVGWFGTVEVVDGGYLITDIFVPKQTVTSTQTDILPEDLADIVMQVDDPEKLYYWGHSHVGMPVAPSGQDEDQTEEYLQHTDVFIRGIYNKRGEAKVDIFDVEKMLVYQCVKNTRVIEGLDKDTLKDLNDTLKTNVIERKHVTPVYKAGFYNSQGYGGSHNATPKSLGGKELNIFLLANFM